MFSVREITSSKIVLDSIQKDVKERTIRGLALGSSSVPRFLQENFESFGERAQSSEPGHVWPNIAVGSLEFRVENTSPLPDVLAQPLMDTGNLATSGEVTQVDELEFHTTLAEYGRPHDIGTAVRPDGVPVPQRIHMYLIEEDLDTINEDFEGAWK